MRNPRLSLGATIGDISLESISEIFVKDNTWERIKNKETIFEVRDKLKHDKMTDQKSRGGWRRKNISDMS